jgi:aminoglycoside phosphotransferase family enzyme/predicted kinase
LRSAAGRWSANSASTAPPRPIYRRLVAITREAGGGLALDGAGAPAEYALEMRRFDPDAVLAEHPEWVDGELAEALGRTIARYHAAAELRPEGGGLAALGYTLASNAEQLRAIAGRLGEDRVQWLLAATDAAFDLAKPLLEARRRVGFARRCHGDLHLGNILLEDGVPRLFDCIEFNDKLCEIDVQYDFAFLAMDLWFRKAAAAANRALNAWLDEAARHFSANLWDGLAAMPLMLSARAAVRAHVSAHQGDDRLASAYLAAAGAHLASASASLTAVGGLSGSGKTTLARRIAPELGAAPGAVVLRSDEIRKRLAGVGPLERLPPAAYSQAESDRVYGEMLSLARRLIGAGRAVVLDAVFLKPDERRAARALAAELAIPFHGVWLEGRPDLLAARLACRTGDASDADARVLQAQLTRDPGPIDWELADAADPRGR